MIKQYTQAETRTNARLKNYPDFALLQISNVPLFATGRFEPHDKDFFNFEKTDLPPIREAPEPETDDTPKAEKIVKDPQRSLEEARRRARAAVRDIALCNRFEMMFTLTFDGTKIDRYDPDACYKAVRAWCSNMSQRKGMKYVLIPEYHKKKSGETSPAIHVHGLAIFSDVELVRATYRDGKPRVDNAGRPVYNISTWRYGWSTAVPLDDTYTKAVAYVCKYIGKQEDKIFGKWYLSSRGASDFRKRPEIIPLDDMDYWAYRDEAKLNSGAQYEQNVFRDVRILSEELWRNANV